jgi:hypothetical protein
LLLTKCFDLKRRNFILLAGIGTGTLLLPPALYFLAPGVKVYAKSLIEKELSYLKLRPVEIEQFVDDYFKASANDTLSTIKWKMIYSLKMNKESSARIFDLIKYFLLSSDFFINKMDESKEIRYLGLFNSYTSPMPNPYSYVIYPPSDV